LANAYFMNNQAGMAVYHYNKAMLLDPRNPDIKANLKFAKDALQLSSPEQGILQRIATTLTINSWCWLFTISFWTCASLCLISKLSKLNRAMLWSIFSLSLIITILSLSGLIGYHLERNKGIVLISETALKRAPTQSSPTNSYLREGEMLTAIDRHSDFIKIETAEGKSGWVKDSDFKKLWD
jgi:hypothetical protein